MPASSDMRIDTEALIAELYPLGSRARDILRQHGERVAAKALDAAAAVPHLKPDCDFIRAAALLHDIGIFLTDTPGLGCYGRHPYICHGYLGRQLLEKKGLPDLALVCERHVGVGISAAEIRRRGLPLPQRDMLPVTIEEQIVCYADKFFSKNGRCGGREKSVAQVVRGIEAFGHDKVKQFLKWVRLFGDKEIPCSAKP